MNYFRFSLVFNFSNPPGDVNNCILTESHPIGAVRVSVCGNTKNVDTCAESVFADSLDPEPSPQAPCSLAVEGRCSLDEERLWVTTDLNVQHLLEREALSRVGCCPLVNADHCVAVVCVLRCFTMC